jgi:hypothetical protein
MHCKLDDVEHTCSSERIGLQLVSSKPMLSAALLTPPRLCVSSRYARWLARVSNPS